MKCGVHFYLSFCTLHKPQTIVWVKKCPMIEALLYFLLTHGSWCAGVICWDAIRILGSSGSFLDPGLHLGHSRINSRVARVSTAGPKTGHTNNSVSKKNQALEVQNKYFLLYLCKSMYKPSIFWQKHGASRIILTGVLSSVAFVRRTNVVTA